jgi:predicted amidohydrolase
MSHVLDVAVVQLNSQNDVSENLNTVERLVVEAAGRGAQLIALPENFAFFGPESERLPHQERLNDSSRPIQRALSDLARKNHVVLVGGGFPEVSDHSERPYNTSVVFNRSGELIASYRKIHLFDVDLADGTRLAESAATTPGSRVETFDVDGFRFGMSICYDIRFPELYRQLSEAGAEVLLAPSAFTLHTGKDHWHVLLRARAIEAQCWMVAAAQQGQHPKGRRTYGHSLVVDPWGTVVADAPDGVGVVVARLDKQRLDEVRRGLPSLEHRRL